MKRIIFLILFITLLTQVFADNTLVMHIVPPTEYYPFAFEDPNGKGSGLIIEILETAAEKNDLRILYKVLPRIRAEKALSDGSIDAYATSDKYLKYPAKFIWSDPVVSNNDYLYSLLQNPYTSEKMKDLYGKRIGTQLGFRYHKFDSYFKAGKMTRDDAVNEYQSLKKLLRKRIDAAIINEWVGSKLLARHASSFNNKFHISKDIANHADICIAFNHKWYEFSLILNKEIAEMKETGELQKLIDKYLN